MNTGRPTTFRSQIAQEILDWVSDGKPLREFCRIEGNPPWRTVYHWRADQPEFAKQFDLAREIGYDAIAEDALAIADTPQIGQIVKEGPKGTEITHSDMTDHRKLRVWTRLQLLSKWSKRYADKTDHAISGPVTLELKGSDRDG